jgi:hypothetical protein
LVFGSSPGQKDVQMLSVGATPMLLSLLVGLLIGFLGWGVARQRLPPRSGRLMEQRDDLLVGLLVLAAFSLGVFLTYLLITMAV